MLFFFVFIIALTVVLSLIKAHQQEVAYEQLVAEAEEQEAQRAAQKAAYEASRRDSLRAIRKKAYEAGLRAAKSKNTSKKNVRRSK